MVILIKILIELINYINFNTRILFQQMLVWMYSSNLSQVFML